MELGFLDSFRTKGFCIVMIGTFLISLLLFVLPQRFDDENPGQPKVEEFCSTHLVYAKAELKAAKSDKDRADKMLADAQKHHETDKSRIDDVMEGCLAMIQQSIGCQEKLDELKMECKKTRGVCSKISEELRLLKNLTNTPLMA